jgi:hypothetical protein
MIATLSPRRAPRPSEQRLSGSQVIELVAAAGEGDHEAWADLTRAFGPMIWAIANAHRLRDADAADVSQATWLAPLEHLGDVKDVGG